MSRLDDLIATHKETAVPAPTVVHRTVSNHVDMNGVVIRLDDIVIRPIRYGNGAALDKCVVTSIKNGNVYLDFATFPIKWPNRIMVVTWLYGNGPLGKPTVR